MDMFFTTTRMSGNLLPFPIFRIIFLSILLSCHILPGSAEETRDSVRVYFHQGKTDIDLCLRDNRQALERICRQVSESRPDTVFSVCKIVVVGAASPEGSVELNRRLSELRAQSLFEYVCRHSPLPDTLKTSVFVGRDWKGLLHLVENEPGMPGKPETMEILRSIVSEVEKGGDGENKIGELKRLRGGEPYRYMYRKLFPELRASRLYIRYETVRKPFPVPDVVVPEEEDILTLTDTLPMTEGKREISVSEVSVLETPAREKSRKPFYMAVKTNMLYDALLVPNIGVEFYLGRNWSLAGNWMYAWWKNDRKHHYWRTYGGDVAIRKWFGNKADEKPLTGHHLGVYGQLFTYDFERGGKGYMGGKPGGTLWDELNYAVGVEYGYSLPVARRLNIDFTLGIGYWGGKFYEYLPADGHYAWQSTKNRHWFGPTRAEVALVWLIGRGNCNAQKGGRR